MKKIFFGLMLLYSGMVYSQVRIGVSIGVPPPPRVEVILAQPGPDYYWIDGYWYPYGGRYLWHAGYWTRPPYSGARWYGPRYEGRSYYKGYWGGGRGNVYHEHRWDNHRGRDFHHEGRGRRH